MTVPAWWPKVASRASTKGEKRTSGQIVRRELRRAKANGCWQRNVAVGHTRYANNNPYKFTDPDGRQAKDWRSLSAHSSNGFSAGSISGLQNQAKAQSLKSQGEKAGAKEVLDRSSINAKATAAAGTGLSVSKNLAGKDSDQIGWVPVGQGAYAGVSLDYKIVDVDLFKGAQKSPFSLEASGDVGAVASIGGSVSLDPGGRLEIKLSPGLGVGEHLSFSPILNVNVNDKEKKP